jgi:hypothetical protein
MKVIESTFRHKGWQEGYRCILEFRNRSWRESGKFTDWRLALAERFGAGYGLTANPVWMWHYYRGRGRIYLREPSIVTMMLLTNPKLSNGND